jgi:hypothetical protein
MKYSFFISSTTSERNIIKNFKGGGCGPLHDSATPLYFRLIKAEYWCFQKRFFFFCASICSFIILKKARDWRLKSLFLFLLLQKSDGKLTEFFRYLRIVITKIWICINRMFYAKSPYLRIPKTIFFWLECHLIMKKCPSKMHQFETADPVHD